MKRTFRPNIEALAERLRLKRYRAKLVRRTYIPKENGKERPLRIPVLEDKLVQRACAKLLMAIYEEDFLSCSYGYRPGRGPLDAVRGLTFDLQYVMLWLHSRSRCKRLFRPFGP
jgi:RNA-directed DNA polymerase